MKFLWHVPPGVPSASGVRLMLEGEATGEGTYRLDRGYPWIIDVPAGIRVRKGGPFLTQGGWGVGLADEATGSVMYISVETGTEGWRRHVTDRSVEILFDRISASIRRE